MYPDYPWTHWSEFMQRLSVRCIDDFDLHARHLDLPRSVILEVRERMQEVLRLELREGNDLWKRDWQEWSRSERSSIEQLAYAQRLLIDALPKIESRLTERLGAIEDRLDATGGPCRYGESGGLGGTASYLTALDDPTTGKVAADPKTFAQKLCATARLARTLVLADPYALSESNDAGDNGDCIAQIVQIVRAGSIEHLHVYARSAAATAKVWAKLQTELGSVKLTVHLGDLHDRYLLAGNDSNKGAYQFDDTWHGFSNWRGVVFGASLNGVAKRPTYVLPFEVSDVKQVRAYLDDHAPLATLESQRTAEKARANRVAAQRALTACAEKSDGGLS